MAYTKVGDLSPMSCHDRRPSMGVTVTWRVTTWETTECARWKIAAVSEHPDGDWPAALRVAREWFKNARDDVERGRLRIRVDPVNTG